MPRESDETRLKSIVAERGKTEQALLKEQDKLRGLDRQKDADRYAAQSRVVNDLKAEIGEISQEQTELARSVARAAGGTNYEPPRT